MPSSQAQGSTVAVSATGESFLAFYTGPRLNPDAVVAGSTGRLAYNTIRYTARLAWYAFPWSLIAFGAFAVALRRYVRQRFHLRVTLRRSAEALSASAPSDPARPRRRSESGVGAEVNPADGSERRSAESGLLFAVVASFVLIVLFSFSDRKADRFIFPAYYFMAAAGAVSAIRRWPAVSRVVNRLDCPWVPAACWLSLFALRLVTGSHLPQFTFWRS